MFRATQGLRGSGYRTGDRLSFFRSLWGKVIRTCNRAISTGLGVVPEKREWDARGHYVNWCRPLPVAEKPYRCKELCIETTITAKTDQGLFPQPTKRGGWNFCSGTFHLITLIAGKLSSSSYQYPKSSNEEPLMANTEHCGCPLLTFAAFDRPNDA